MSAESPRHARAGTGGPLTVPSQPPSDRSLIDAVSGFISDVTLSSASQDPKDVIQWARFETADINEPTPEDAGDNDISPLLLILGYGSGVQVWLIPPTGEAQEVLSWRQGTVRVLRILPSPQHGDCFASKRPLIALCDSASPGPSFCSLSFISIRGGEQVKSIKFKNPILDVLANKRSVVVSFSERFAVFDAATLEDRMAITTCYPCPCPLGGSQPINPLALGDRWLAYADKKLNQSKRSSGGCEGEGATSYTATVLHAAKSLSKGLRGLGESVAHSLAGGRGASQSPSPPHGEPQQRGVVTVLHIESNEDDDGQEMEEACDPIVAHFVAHSDAIIALKFDASGLLLVTADRRGHDFHVFRLNPHPCGPALASVHHLYVLHRGDTTAKVQDIAISSDSRWTAISTLRGTTHVFAISPYGGACGVRTHASPRVVNRLSRFHRSAGLPIHAPPAHSPVSDGLAQGAWFPNPRLPPYPSPTTAAPLAQLRPTANLPTHTITRTSSGRQRLSSLSEDSSTVPLLARARFGLAPCAGAGAPRASPAAALYLVAASGCLSHIALHPRPARGVPKEKLCDESPIEVEVEPLAQWALQRPAAAGDLLAPLPPASPLLQPPSCRRCADMCMSEEERWLSQVEIVTHAGPHRRLWMGPQFVFKTYNCTGSNSSLSEAETVEVDPCGAGSAGGVARSNPVNMPGARPVVPVLIDSGSASSLEQSPSDSFRRKSLLAESGRAASVCDVQLKEDLAEAMKEDHGWRLERSAVSAGPTRGAGVERAVDPQGTVVAPPAGAPVPPPDDPDSYTSSNADEARFRPVVRAPAAISLRPDLVVRPLPRTTTIPVQTVSPLGHLSPEDEPLPLNTDVVIPAALTHPWSRVVEAIYVETAPDVAVKYATEEISGEVTTPTVATDEAHKNTEVEIASEIYAIQKDTAAKKEQSSDKPEKSPSTRATPARNPACIEDKPARRRSKEVEIDKITAETKEKTIQIEKPTRKKDTFKTEKSTRQKDSVAPKPAVTEQRIIEADKPVSQKVHKSTKFAVKDTESFTDPSSEQKDTASQIDKSFRHKDSASTFDNSTKLEQYKEDKILMTEAKIDLADLQTILGEPRDKTTEPNKRTAAEAAVNVDRINLDFKLHDVNKDLKCQNYGDDVWRPAARKMSSAAGAEREREDSKSLPKWNPASDDIQPTARNRIKKSPTPKSVSDRDSDVSVKDNKTKRVSELKEVHETKDVKETKEIKKQKDVREPQGSMFFREIKEVKSRDDQQFCDSQDFVDVVSVDDKKDSHNKDTKVFTEEPESIVTLRLPKKELQENKSKNRQSNEIKTEDQAWHLLLTEPEKPVVINVSQQSIFSDKSEDKPKWRKGRKSKKTQDDSQTKTDEDSFVEIHAIEEKQSCSGDLVSISTRFEDVGSSTSYLAKAKKSRSSKSCTPEKTDDYEFKSVDSLFQATPEPYSSKLKSSRKYEVSDIEVHSETRPMQLQRESFKDAAYTNLPKVKKHYDGTASETSLVVKEPVRTYKSKSLSPYPEARKFSDISVEISDKDVYVIDSTGDDFPDIQITTANKSRKKSPQPAERRSLEKEPVIEKPVVKSWSSIAASKKVEEVEKEVHTDKRMSKLETKDKMKNVASALDDRMSSTAVSLQDKLIELCKRTDIMVAECDAPSELNFVDEHHAVLHDLPPLEPLDFGLDDFNLEVMRDSLLEVNDTKLTSPICKINIDDILSSIKETTSKVLESSSFNLIDLEKVPSKVERGFRVIGSHKITQEVKLDDDRKPEETKVMEKSSDEDVASPAVTTDSDKEDKKPAGASNMVLPSTKQSVKSKKPRRKKK